MLRSGAGRGVPGLPAGLGIDEAWLSEAKPSVQAFWNDDLVITEEERRWLVRLQDRATGAAGMTVNYLGHFEGRSISAATPATR